MVSKSTSILLAVAVVAVSAVAIIGLGYAYTAATENTGNTTDIEYVVLAQKNAAGNADQYAFGTEIPIKFDTMKTSSETKYRLSGASVIGAYTAIQLGTTIKLTPTGHNVDAAAKTIAVKSTGMTAGNGWAYILSDGTNYSILSSSNGAETTWTGTLNLAVDEGEWVPTSVSLYYGCLTTALSDGWLTSASGPTDLTGSEVITFTITFS